MRGLFVDTGIWVALLDASDPLHAKAKSVLESHRGMPVVLTELVLSESVTLLRRQVGLEKAAAFALDLETGGKGVTIVRSEPDDWRSGIDILRKYPEQKISFADAVSFAVVRRLDLENVASFDKHFRIVLTERRVVGW